jgi:uncharacterized protein (DUF849 family)
MDLGMTAQALFAQQSLIATIGWNTRAAVNTTWVEGGNVALLAHPGLPTFLQEIVIGAMWCMAVGAIFLHRGVFPQEGAALFRVALVAGLVDGALC